MTTQEELAALVVMQPWNDTFADMLFEWWYCDADRSWAEAEAEVKRVRVPALAAWHIAKASEVLVVGAKYRGRVNGRIRAAVGEMWNYVSLVLLVEGKEGPRVVGCPDGHPGAAHGEPCVFVGAEWVLKTRDEVKAAWDAVTERKKPRAVKRRRGGSDLN